MRKLKYVLAAAAVLVSGNALANSYMFGTVSGVYPRTSYENVRTLETQCHNETIQHGGHHSSGADPFNVVTGAVLGGVLGNVLSKGKRGATIGGAAVGTILGATYKNDHHHSRGHVSTQRICNDVWVDHQRERVTHYEVEYDYYGGRGSFLTTDHYYVGQRIQVNINTRRY